MSNFDLEHRKVVIGGVAVFIIAVYIVITHQESLSVVLTLHGRQFWEPAFRNNLLMNRLILRQPLLEMHRAT